MLYREITACRSCGSASLETVLDLGNLYISDFIKPGEAEERAPLELVYCKECSLVQLRHTVSRDHLYKDQYWYKSSTNESMVAALKDVVEDAMQRVSLQPDDKVLDIGCNDGTMLFFYPSFVNRYGYEPAWNLWTEAKKKSGGCIYPTYFPRNAVKGDKFKVITSIAQFYNTEDVNAYVAAIKRQLHPEGVWVVQMQDLDSMLLCNGIDNICHEHLAYWDDVAFERLINRHGLCLGAMNYNQTNGGSVRYTVYSYGPMRDRPRGINLPLLAFGQKAKLLKTETLNLLHQLKAEGKTVLGVAASTKANTLLQYYGIGPELLPAIADRNKEKVGLVTVGTHIPIISEKELYERKPDYLLALAWHFFEPFRVRYSSLEEAGAKWIVPLPTLKVISEVRSDIASSGFLVADRC